MLVKLLLYVTPAHLPSPDVRSLLYLTHSSMQSSKLYRTVYLRSATVPFPSAAVSWFGQSVKQYVTKVTLESAFE